MTHHSPHPFYKLFSPNNNLFISSFITTAARVIQLVTNTVFSSILALLYSASPPAMGQSSSTFINSTALDPREIHRSLRFLSGSTAATVAATEMLMPMMLCDDMSMNCIVDGEALNRDYTNDVPDDCLGYIFTTLSSGDRKRCSLVCKRWLHVEGQSRQRLSLNAQSEITPHLSSILARFESVTKIALRSDRRTTSIDDEALVLISIRCPNLTRLKIRGCREISDVGIARFGKNCRKLNKLSCGSCVFGSKGMNAFLNNCVSLEELSVKRLRGNHDSGGGLELIGPGIAASSLKILSLKELCNGQSFGPLIIGAKKLHSLKLFRCLGDWDQVLEMVGKENPNLQEVHLERLQVSDTGLSAISRCRNLEVLHIVKTPDCTNLGLVMISERCKLLRKLHIDGWRTNRIGDEGLIAIAKQCPNLQELVLIGVNPTSTSLIAIASHCKNLERLALCGSETIGDAEISSIAEKCVALRKICIKGCPISNHGMETFVWGFPSLVKVKVRKCRAVTNDIGIWLKVNRKSLVVALDAGEAEAAVGVIEIVEAHGNGGFIQPRTMAEDGNNEAASSSNGRSPLLRARTGFVAGRKFVAFTLRKWSNGNNGSNLNN